MIALPPTVLRYPFINFYHLIQKHPPSLTLKKNDLCSPKFVFLTMDPLVNFNYRVEDAVSSKNGEKLNRLLSMWSSEAMEAMEVYVLDGGSLPKAMPDPWDALPDLVRDRFAAGSALNANNWVESCLYLRRAMDTYLNILSKDDAWSLPLLQSMCRDLRVVAEQADIQLRQEGMKVSKLEEVERVLKRAFSITNNDRRTIAENSRKLGTLDVINQLLKVYFKLNNLRLCSNVVKVVDAPNFPNFERTYPVSHRVTYKYFTGRLHLYADRNAESIKDLTYAFKHTPEQYAVNKRLELLYLIPAQILCGRLPSKAILEKYKMHWFMGIVEGLRTGNLGIFNATLDRYEEFFIKKALFLTMEKMRLLVYRSLCKRIYRISGSHKLNLEAFRRCLRVCGVDMDKDESECILANLIYNNVIKGYISHKVGVLVLSKRQAFPPIAG